MTTPTSPQPSWTGPSQRAGSTPETGSTRAGRHETRAEPRGWTPETPTQPPNPHLPHPQPSQPSHPSQLPSQQPTGVAPLLARPSAYPTKPTIYPHALRSPRSRWWRGLLAIVLLVLGYLVASAVLSIPAVAFDIATGRTTMADYTAGVEITPAILLATNLGLAAMMPLAFGLQRWLFGQRPRFLSSVEGGFRWRWLLKAAAVVVPVYLVYVVGFSLLGGMPLTGGTDVVAFLIIVVVTTPLQAAGEEYAARGLINRAAGSWFAKPVAALVVGGLINSLLFMVAHGATDPWLLVYYFFFGAIMTLLAWRTGGLEVPILLHAINNLFLFVPSILAGQMNGITERGAGAGSPVMLIPMAVALLTLGLVEWRARRVGVVTQTTPPPELDPAAPVPATNQPTNPMDQVF